MSQTFSCSLRIRDNVSLPAYKLQPDVDLSPEYLDQYFILKYILLPRQVLKEQYFKKGVPVLHTSLPIIGDHVYSSLEMPTWLLGSVLP